MITIESGKFIIPEEERFIGFAGDEPTSEIQIGLLHFTDRNCTFTLCLRFDDGTVRTAALSPVYYSSNVLLTWNVRREHLYARGIVTAQVKIVYPNGEVMHTTRDYFLIGSSVEDGGEDVEDYVTRDELTVQISDTKAEVKAYAVAYTDSAVQGLARAQDVYTKTEIDEMIGDLEDELAAI
ncbi:MAG: hypothetical protein IJI50_04340 [Ruminococcus sp.]|nr:hypothetical protein [Ruminococcus sp.]